MGSKISKRSADYFVISHGLERECQCCHNTEWMGEKIMLEIHHIDGDKTNNDDSNIMILCPNCHSLTDNYKAKNRKKELKQEYFCTKCGKKLYGFSKTGLCGRCVRDAEMEQSVCNNSEQLEKDMKELKSYSKVAKKYGVSDKTIAKWCKKFGIKKS